MTNYYPRKILSNKDDAELIVSQLKQYGIKAYYKPMFVVYSVVKEE